MCQVAPPIIRDLSSHTRLRLFSNKKGGLHGATIVVGYNNPDYTDACPGE